jgi:hypothetical protein
MTATGAYASLRRPSTIHDRGAHISSDGFYRYGLWRTWDYGPWLPFVMLNPSTADANLDDPTIRRCIGFAKREGYGGIRVVNLYAYRSTSPKALLTCADPVGPENDGYLYGTLAAARTSRVPVIAAWGANARLDRVARVLNLLPGAVWRCLGTTKQGAPKHPLYIKSDQPLVPYPWAALASAKGESAGAP